MKDKITKIISDLSYLDRKYSLFALNNGKFTQLTVATDEDFDFDKFDKNEAKIYYSLLTLVNLKHPDGNFFSESNFRYIKKNFNRINWVESDSRLFIPVTRLKGKLKDVIFSDALVHDLVIDHDTYLTVIGSEMDSAWEEELKDEFLKNILEYLDSEDSEFSSEIIDLIDLRDFFEKAASYYEINWEDRSDHMYIDAEDVAWSIEDSFIEKYMAELRSTWAKSAGQKELFAKR